MRCTRFQIGWMGGALLLALLMTQNAFADEPATSKTLFDSSKITLGAEKKSELATAIGIFVRNSLGLSDANNFEAAKHFLAVALTLDPKNKTAYVADTQIKQGRIPPEVEAESLDAKSIVEQMMNAANSLKDSQVEDDRKLAAYLYSLVLIIRPNHEDAIFESGMLADAGVKAAWSSIPDGGPNQPQAVIPFADLLLGLTFNRGSFVKVDNSTYITDVSNNNKHITSYGASIAEGRDDDNGVRFTDPSRYIEVNDTVSLRPVDEITVAAWVNPMMQPPVASIVDKHDRRDKGARGYLLYLNSGFPKFGIGSKNEWYSVESDRRAQNGQWTHVAGTFNGKQVRLFVNGKLVAEKPAETQMEPSIVPLRIAGGAAELTRERAFAGVIDEVMVFSRALSDSEIAALFQRTEEEGTTYPEVFPTSQPSSDEPVVYLGDLEFNQRVTELNEKWAKGLLGDPHRTRLSINGVETPNGLSAHPATEGESVLRYSLGKKYKRFIGSVALNDTVLQSRSPLTFRIRGDRKELWKSRPIQESKVQQYFDVDVSGVSDLLLTVHCPGDFQNAHAVWVEPRLSAGPAQRMSASNGSTAAGARKNQATIKSMMVRIADDGQMLGSVSDVIATVSYDGAVGPISAKFIGEVGEEMKISCDEALRTIRLRYPDWTGKPLELSFGEKYTKHDGGSAGMAFAVLMVSIIGDTTVDSDFAVTGDITVDGKVRKIGGVAAKLRGAQLDKCPYALIPADNAESVANLSLLYDDSVLWDVQLFSMATLDEGLAVLRTDRDAKLTEAIMLFKELQSKRSGVGVKNLLAAPATQKTLAQIIELAPNHLSARHLLAIAKNEAPKTLSANASLYQFFVAAYPYLDILFKDEAVKRGSLATTTTATTRKRLLQLRPIANRSIQGLLTEFSKFVEACDRANNGRGNANELRASRNSVISKLIELQADREVMEKLVREGF